jgi:phenylacetate-CoA ligase
MCVAIEADHRANRPYEDLAADVRREIRARLGFNAMVECLPEGTLPRYGAKATRVPHRAEASGAAATS